MSGSKLSHPLGTYKLSIYSFRFDQNTQMLVVCHDRLPVRFNKFELIEASYEHNSCEVLAESTKSFSKPDILYESFVKSLSETDPNKVKYEATFENDIKRDFFVMKIDLNLINSRTEYKLRAFDIGNNKNLILSAELRGRSLKINPYIEIYSFFLTIIEEPIVIYQDQNDTCGDICKIACIRIVAAIIVGVIIAIATI